MGGLNTLSQGTKCIFCFIRGGKLWNMVRLLFGHNCSPTLCVFLLGRLFQDVVHKGVLLVHFLADFLFLGDIAWVDLRDIRRQVADPLTEDGFLVSPKRTINPVTFFV